MIASWELRGMCVCCFIFPFSHIQNVNNHGPGVGWIIGTNSSSPCRIIHSLMTSLLAPMHISPLNFGFGHQLVLVKQMLVEVTEAEAWNVFVYLDLSYCALGMTMRKAWCGSPWVLREKATWNQDQPSPAQPQPTHRPMTEKQGAHTVSHWNCQLTTGD